jgi:hypothetical protein
MTSTTSGTVALSVVDITTLMEHAFRRCGKLPSTVSGEQQLAALESLFFLLTDLVNDGISLWCIQRSVIPLVPGVGVYTMPPGTSDVMSSLYRTQVALTGTLISGASYVGLSFVVATLPTNAQIKFSVASMPSLVVEYSQDNSTWVQATAFSKQQSTVATGSNIAVDVTSAPPALFWRVRDTSGAISAGATVVFSNTPSEIPMEPLNRDDYWNLPNKTIQGSRSLQYWYDKQISPQIWLWPVPSIADQVVVEVHRQIQDVGSLTNLLEVPQRWYEYVVSAWASKICLELPAGEVPPGRLEYLDSKAEYHLNRAADGESDGAPIRLQPAIRGYTRG